MIDRSGLAATFTGSQCLDWAGGTTGSRYVCQGNILSGPRVLDAMMDTFESSEADLSTRLLDALFAADCAGGDSRGRSSAGILVVREGGGYPGDSDVAVDLRVDDHTDPVPELQRLYSFHRLLFSRASKLVFIDMDEEMVVEVRTRLADRGHAVGTGVVHNEAERRALLEFVGTENLEARWRTGKQSRGVSWAHSDCLGTKLMEPGQCQ